MNSITRGIQAVSAVILVLVAPMSLTLAQEPGSQGGSSPAPPAMEGLDRMTTPERGGKDMEERIRHFEAKRREKLLQALQLDEATRTRLTQRLEQLDQKAQDLQPLGLLTQGLHGFLPLAPQILRFLVQLFQPLGKPGTGCLVQLQGLQQVLPPLGFEVPDAFLHVLAAAFRRRHAVKPFHRRWRWR